MSGSDAGAAHARARAAVVVTGLVSASLFGYLAWDLAPLEPGVLALQFAFSPRAFAEVVHQWSAQDLARYRAHLPIDGLLLVSYALFGVLAATRTRLFAASGPGSVRRAALLLPAAALCDAFENLMHWWLTGAPRFGVPWAYALAAGLSSLKWLGLLGFAWLSVRALRGAAGP